MKIFTGYVLGVDAKKMYSIILDSDEEKSYQMDCELEYINTDNSEITAERKFNMSVTENGEMSFEFLNEKINENITVQDLKDNMNIVSDVDDYIAKGD